MQEQLINQFIAEQLPAMAAIGAEVESFDSKQLVLKAPLALNHNGRGIAFGASIYSIAMMAGFATMYVACRQYFDNPNILLRDGQIRYRAPCNEDIIRATCRNPDEKQWEGFFAHYEKTGKTTLSLTSKIMSGGEMAAYFDGVFVLLGE